MITNLNAISKITVGGSAEYGVVSSRATTRISSPEGQTRESYRETVWDIECLTTINDPTTISALKATLASELARIGQTVTLHEFSQTRVLAAAGVGGTLPGYPITEVGEIVPRSFGVAQAFTLKVTTRVGIADGSNIVEHTSSTETTVNTDGTSSTTVRGSLRMAPGQNAVAYINTNIFDPARTQADIDGDVVISRVGNREDADAAAADYTYTVSPQGTNGPDASGVTRGSVEDKITKDKSGRRTRVISGYAVGPNATTYAGSQKVNPTSTLILLREEGPTTPSIPDGRVAFRYEYAFGYASASYPDITILRLDGTVVDAGSGGRGVIAAQYHDGDPVLRLGLKREYRYSESIQLEFIGEFADAMESIDHQFDADNLDGQPSIRMGASGLIKTISVGWNFVYAQPYTGTLPTPQTIDGVAS